MGVKEREILDRIYALLQIASPEVLLRASEVRAISAHVKVALEALALEALGDSARRHDYGPDVSEQEILHRRTPAARSAVYSAGGQRQGDVEQITDILVNSKRFASKADILAFSNDARLSVDVSSKDSRARAARKLAKAIVECPRRRKERVLAMLYDMFGEQTRGWIDIIRTR